MGSPLGAGTIADDLEAEPPLANGIIPGAMPNIADVSGREFGGAMQSGGGISSDASQVPEPSALVLLAIGGLMLVRGLRPH
jgi:hypothetical protein